jgi:hypothetical protein
MNLQAKRLSGSTFSAEDILEVLTDTGNQEIISIVHTIELVSGVNVTHGGGGQPNDYLHYKASERDANEDGIIDYSTSTMSVVQVEQGTSVIKVVAMIRTAATKAAYQQAYADFVNQPLDEQGTGTAPEEVDFNEVLKTGELVLTWGNDTLV